MRNNHRTSCHCRAFATSANGGATFGEPYTVPSLSDSVCQGSMVAAGGSSRWFYTGPNDPRNHQRTNLSLSASTEGVTWSPLLSIWPEFAAYSSLAVLPNLQPVQDSATQRVVVNQIRCSAANF